MGLIAAGGVEGELAEDFAGGGVDHGDVQAVDEQGDGLMVAGAADADGVEGAGVAQGDLALVDAVDPDSGVDSVRGFTGRGGFGSGLVGGDGGCAGRGTGVAVRGCSRGLTGRAGPGCRGGWPAPWVAGSASP